MNPLLALLALGAALRVGRSPAPLPRGLLARQVRARTRGVSLAVDGDAVQALADQAAALADPWALGDQASALADQAAALADPEALRALGERASAFGGEAASSLRSFMQSLPTQPPTLAAPELPELEDLQNIARAAAEAAKPYVEAGSEKAAEVASSLGASALRTAGKLGGDAVDAASSAFRGSLTPDQLDTADSAARVSGQAAEMAGVIARVVGKGLSWAWTESAPARQEVGRAVVEGAQSAGEAAAPLVKDLLDDGAIGDETVESAKAAAAGLASDAGQGVGRAAAFGLRGAARLLDGATEMITSDGAEPSGLSALNPANLASKFGAGFGRAAAPLAATTVVALVALGALRDLARPVERVASGVVGVAVLGLCAKLLTDNWEQVYHAFEVLDGKAPIFGS
ncbi:hypothetical protein T492DRAFT_995797 [Pavlovales sp. CCMP2436]|nr:hypothetical protein T492DRAFT_995797 [Pavlovales sp. CCMP2436]